MKQIILLFLSLYASFLCNAGNTKPNIIFIFADDWGYADLGIHGSTFCKTPNLDQMAAEGSDFQNFTVSNPVCSPSRAAVMTGQYPARHSVHRHFAKLEHHLKYDMPDWLDPAATMLPRLLQKQGYVTGHFGKWHLSNISIPDGPLPPEYGYDEYAAHNLPGCAPEQLDPVNTLPMTLDFIKRHKDQPFFINMWLHESHTPHYPLDEYLAQFEDLDERQQVYAAIIAEGDAKVGKVLDTLKELGIDKHTLVLFSSDNGPEWTKDTKDVMDDASTGAGLGRYYSVGETGGLRGRKRSTFAGGVRVPLIAWWPGVIPEGKTDRSTPLNAVDLLPTFVELAGGALPEGYEPDGVDIMPALLGEAFERSRPIYWEWKNPDQAKNDYWPTLAVRDGKWRLFLNDESGRAELYDIENDWAENNDVSKEYPEITEKLIKQVLAWKATLPEKPPASCLSKIRAE